MQNYDKLPQNKSAQRTRKVKIPLNLKEKKQRNKTTSQQPSSYQSKSAGWVLISAAKSMKQEMAKYFQKGANAKKIISCNWI